MEYPKIAEKLMKMREEDQSLRKKISYNSSDLKLVDKIEEVDKENIKKLQGIINQIGWPTISKVGKGASNAAWLVVQHADKNLEFQKKCLQLLKKNVNDVDRGDIAYLTDRILVHEGKSQVYGTQFYQSGIDKKLEPRPIKSMDNLNALRKEMGMEPFEESIMYQKMIEHNKNHERNRNIN